MALSDSHKEHLKGYGPMYTLIVLLLGGGGVATLSDNIPVTQAQFKAWADDHTAHPHDGVDDTLNEVQEGLTQLKIESLRGQLRQAYTDACTASGAALAYIDKEIERLEALYFKLTKREYDPPPCTTN